MNRGRQIDLMERRAQAMMKLIPEPWEKIFKMDQTDPDLMTHLEIDHPETRKSFDICLSSDGQGFSVWNPMDDQESDPDPVFETDLDLDIVKFLETLK